MAVTRWICALIFFACVIPPLAVAQKIHDPLTEGEVIRLLQRGVAPERVGKLARESGITFDVTPAVEGDLRDAGATDELLQTMREVAASRGGAKTTKESPKTHSPETKSGTLLITTDAPCKVRIDGEDAGELAPDGSKKVSVAFGQHLVRATSNDDPTVTTQWTGNAATTEQVLIQLSLVDKIASARTNREKQAADAVEDKRMRSFTDILGQWKWREDFYLDLDRKCPVSRTFLLDLRQENQNGFMLVGDLAVVHGPFYQNITACRKLPPKRKLEYFNNTQHNKVTLSHIRGGEGYSLNFQGGGPEYTIRMLSPTRIELTSPEREPEIYDKVSP